MLLNVSKTNMFIVRCLFPFFSPLAEADVLSEMMNLNRFEGSKTLSEPTGFRSMLKKSVLVTSLIPKHPALP